MDASADRLTGASVPADPGLDPALDEMAALTREQLQAAWQLHVDRVSEALQRDWGEHIHRVVEERFAELRQRAQHQLALAVDSARQVGSRAVTERLNHTARHLRHAENEEQWIAELEQAAGRFAARSIVLRIRGGSVIWGTSRVPLTMAPAVAGAIESGDTLVALRTPGELSEALLEGFGPSEQERVYLFPVAAAAKTAAVVYAEPELDVHALELLCLIAASAYPKFIESESRAAAAASSFVQIGAVRTSLDWQSLDRPVQDAHLRAQRFARVQVAEMRLYQSQAVKDGRAGRNLYQTLRPQIDAARQEYSRQFLEFDSMVDYLHQELVRTLANDDASLLGVDYPGPLR